MRRTAKAKTNFTKYAEQASPYAKHRNTTGRKIYLPPRKVKKDADK